MIKLTDSNGAAIYLAPAAIASIQQAGPSSAWHGIRSYVRTFDGKTYEVQQDASEINAAVDAAQQRSEA
ncbi:hypothetical protein LMG26788_02147 [Achromobacter pulmonis]|uniref:Uncharacterized protein n=1 Tax=Achromobacter pulmonis TaxID=1389932 RepID=A0A6S7D3K4_9BURK|nr:hypothetical protein [Achromobacter pulmonis]CAB3858744.1 hypothetical protein LMG26788_02147 [Achromobacter pulmonis]